MPSMRHMHIPRNWGMRKVISSIFGALGMPRIAAIEPHRIAASNRRGPVVWLILSGILLIAGIMIGTAVMVDQFRERALSNGERELENTVLLLTRHFDQQFKDCDIIANDLISTMEISGMASPEIFNRQISTPAAHMMLKSKVGFLSYIGDVNIFDSDGKLINSSAAWPLPAISIADRAYFKAFKSSPEPTVLAEPVRSYYTGGWTTVIAYRLSGVNGVFLGG